MSFSDGDLEWMSLDVGLMEMDGDGFGNFGIALMLP